MIARRPPAELARPRPTGAIALILLVARSTDKPCTDQDVASACSLRLDQVPAFVEDLEARGIIEIEDEGGRRRLRVRLGNWSRWTARPGFAVRGSQLEPMPSRKLRSPGNAV